jgi:NADH-quinone oxidoreductase subunit M
VGTFQAHPAYAALATLGVVVTAAYLLAWVGRTFHGPTRADLASMVDLQRGEVAVLVPLIVVIFWVGLYPRPLLERSEATVRALVGRASAAGIAVGPAARRHVVGPSAPPAAR